MDRPKRKTGKKWGGAVLLCGLLVLAVLLFRQVKRPAVDPFAALCDSGRMEVQFGFIRDRADGRGGYYFIFDDLADRVRAWDLGAPVADQPGARTAAGTDWALELILCDGVDIPENHFSIPEDGSAYVIHLYPQWAEVNGVFYQPGFAEDLNSSARRWWTYYRDHQEELFCSYVFLDGDQLPL